MSKHSGSITALPAGKRFGFIRSRETQPSDGRDWFFHYDGCVCGEDLLKVGAAVTFEVAVGHNGREHATFVNLAD